MSKNAQIRLLGLIERLLIDGSGEEFSFPYRYLAEHAPLRLGANDAEMRKVHETQKVRTPMPFSEHHLVGMKRERKSLFEKISYERQETFKLGLIAAQEYKVVVIAHVVFALQFSLHVLIEWVQIHVRHQLRGQITKRNTFTGLGLEASDDLPQERQKLRVIYRAGAERKQLFMAHAVKKSLDVALQYPDRLRAIKRQTICECLQTQNGGMNAFLSPRSVRVEYEPSVKEWYEKTTNGMVEDAVPNRSFCDLPLLGIVNDETCVGAMFIDTSHQILSELDDVVFKSLRKLQHIFLLHLAVPELTPSGT